MRRRECLDGASGRSCRAGFIFRSREIRRIFTCFSDRATISAGDTARSYSADMRVRKTIRLLAVSFAVFALLTFSTVVVSDFDCHNAADDAHCPYCHLTHQAPAEPAVTQAVSVLQPMAYLPLPNDSSLATSPVFSHTAPRAPPA